MDVVLSIGVYIYVNIKGDNCYGDIRVLENGNVRAWIEIAKPVV